MSNVSALGSAIASYTPAPAPARVDRDGDHDKSPASPAPAVSNRVLDVSA